jgi:hypothetical protein
LARREFGLREAAKRFGSSDEAIWLPGKQILLGAIGLIQNYFNLKALLI